MSTWRGKWRTQGPLALTEPFFVSPLYVYFLAGVFALGGSLTVVRTIQIVLGAVAVGLLFVTTRHWFGERAAWVAAALAILTGLFTFYEILILQAALDPFLVSLTLALVSRSLTSVRPPVAARRRGGRRPARSQPPERARVWRSRRGLARDPRVANADDGARGASAAQWSFPQRCCSCSARAVCATTPPPASGSPSRRTGVSTSTSGTTPAPTAPTARCPASLRRSPVRRVTRRGWRRPRWAGVFRRPTCPATSTDRRWTGSGSHPLAATRLFAWKSALVVNRADVPLNFSYAYYSQDESSLLRGLVVGPWLIVPLGLVGLFLRSARRGQPGFWIWASFVPVYGLSIALFFVTSRYRLPCCSRCAPWRLRRWCGDSTRCARGAARQSYDSR
jgi:hypothetical protein